MTSIKRVRDDKDWNLPIVGILAGAEKMIDYGPPIRGMECPKCGQHTIVEGVARRWARVLFFTIAPIKQTKQELVLCTNDQCKFKGRREQYIPADRAVAPVAVDANPGEQPPRYIPPASSSSSAPHSMPSSTSKSGVREIALAEDRIKA